MQFFSLLKKLFSPVGDDPIAFAQNIFEAICVSMYTIFSIEVMKRLLIELESGDELDYFYRLLGIYVTITICAIVARFFIKHWGWARISFDGVARQTQKYLELFIKADGNQVEKIGTGRFISILDKGLYQWMDVLFNITFSGVVNIIMVMYAIYTISIIDWRGGLGAFLLMVLSAIVATYANIWMTKKREYRRKEQNEANHQTVIALMSKNELLQNHGLRQISSKIDIHLRKAKEYQFIVNTGFLVIEEFPRFIFLLIRVVVYVFIAKKIFVLDGGIVELSIFVTIMAVAEKSLNEFLHLLRDILREFSSISILWSTFDSLTPIHGYDSGSVFRKRFDDIILEKISYGYGDANIFEDFSLTIERGKRTALVGASGGGKTTLMKLIAGYLHPESGYISIMGNRLDQTALKTYYPHIGYLTQEPSVFDATIRENLISAMNVEKISSSEDNLRGHKVSQDNLTPEQKLHEALRLAHCDFVFDLEKGLDTQIGERGIRLSGGQKQRLAIAKIFLKNPDIILLDEPTSALDSFSEEQITKALDELFIGRTVIIIAHRLQTVKKSDDIIVIEGGAVIERGNHDALVMKNGIYHKMLELQSGF